MDATAVAHTCAGENRASLARLLSSYGLEVIDVPPGSAIPGSFWGEPEAGIQGTRVFIRPDTPVHSALHEACHVICMDAERRAHLDTDAGGDFDEENAVCFLQLVLADRLPGIGHTALAADMDRWGYTFRLGSALTWFRHDADDARRWLQSRGLLSDNNEALPRSCRAAAC